MVKPPHILARNHRITPHDGGGTSVNMDLVTFTPEAALHNPGNLEGHALIEGEYMCQKDLARFQVLPLTKFCST